MRSKNSNNNYKKLDSYSLLICSKYFTTKKDYINIMCVCKKFKETTEKLRFNPIPIKSLKLFPKIQTQYLYSKYNEIIEGIDNYEIWYEMNYFEYIQINKENTKCHSVKYSRYHEEFNNKIIPYGVTEICESLISIKNVKKLIIPPTVKKLCDCCFNKYTALTSINIPSLITSIPKGCFQHCSSLQSLIIPNFVTSFGDFSFNNCSSLTSINIPSLITSIPKSCYQHCSSLKSLIIPDSVILFCYGCFYECTSLTSINIPSLITYIPEGRFQNCSSLKTIDIPNSISSFNGYSFSYCTSLTSINISSSVSMIKRYCFQYCYSLENILLPNPIPTIEIGCFSGCHNLKITESMSTN